MLSELRLSDTLTYRDILLQLPGKFWIPLGNPPTYFTLQNSWILLSILGLLCVMIDLAEAYSHSEMHKIHVQ